MSLKQQHIFLKISKSVLFCLKNFFLLEELVKLIKIIFFSIQVKLYMVNYQTSSNVGILENFFTGHQSLNKKKQKKLT